VAANGVGLDAAVISMRPSPPGPRRHGARAGARFPNGVFDWNFWATHDARHQKNLAVQTLAPMPKKVPTPAAR
jgi:hypothetical protein